MRIGGQVAERFAFSNCDSHCAQVKRFVATGAGPLKIIHWQNNEFLNASGRNCGFTELDNSEMLERRSKAVDVLDLLFGG